MSEPARHHTTETAPDGDLSAAFERARNRVAEAVGCEPTALIVFERRNLAARRRRDGTLAQPAAVSVTFEEKQK